MKHSGETIVGPQASLRAFAEERRKETCLAFIIFQVKLLIRVWTFGPLSLAMKACRTFFCPLLRCDAGGNRESVRLESCQQSSIKSGVPFMTTHYILQSQAP